MTENVLPGFGYREPVVAAFKEGAEVGWGARAIWETPTSFSLVHDRNQCWLPDGLDQAEKDRRMAAMKVAMNAGWTGMLSNLKEIKIHKDDDFHTPLYDDGNLVIQANAKKSYGYVYLCAWLRKAM
jgi:hypothetical protein